jgi:hypothetical protein
MRRYDHEHRERTEGRPREVPWRNAPMYGWGWWGGAWGWPPEAMVEPVRPRRDFEGRRAVPPRQSPLFGRSGDDAVRRWAERYGYDFELTVRPRPPRREPYDSSFGRGRMGTSRRRP